MSNNIIADTSSQQKSLAEMKRQINGIIMSNTSSAIILDASSPITNYIAGHISPNITKVKKPCFKEFHRPVFDKPVMNLVMCNDKL